jgi:uncharacterized membrane protein
MDRLKLKILGSVAAGFAALFLSTASAVASQPQATTIDVKGAVVTVASGINAAGSIVGWYCLELPCNSAHTRGFLRDKNGMFTPINVPNSTEHPATGTQPRYISPQGVVVGAYFTLENGATVKQPRFRGFAWFKNQFMYFDAPDVTSDGQPVYDNPSFAHSIIPRAMNAEGQIVGCIHDKDQMNSMHGFVLNPETGAFSRLAMGMSMNNGITESGEIVGIDFAMGTGYHIFKSGSVETISVPGALVTQAWDINSRGEIVGTTVVGDVQHAFLRSQQGDYSFVDPDVAVAATAFGINSEGDVVGNYLDGNGAVHGFLMPRASEGDR